MGSGGEDHGGGVGSDVPSDAGQHVGTGGRVGLEVELGGRPVDRLGDLEGERGDPERGRVEAEQEVVHDRIADEDQLEDLVACGATLLAEPADEFVERRADCPGQLDLPSGVHHHVGDPAHEVLAEPDLGVHGPGGGECRAGRQVEQVAGQGGGTDVDGDAERPVAEPRPDGHDLADVAYGHGCKARSVGHDVEVGGQLKSREAPLAAQGRQQVVALAELDQAQHQHRVEFDVAQVDVLADHLAVDLALCGHVDDEVPADRGGAAQPPVLGQRSPAPVVGFDGARRGEVGGVGRDAVLGELAEHGLDLAASADAATTADRVDVDAQSSGSVEHRGAGRDVPAAP